MITSQDLPKTAFAPRGGREALLDRIDRTLAGNTIPASVAWLAATSVLLPALVVLWMTFVPGLPVEPGFTLDNYSRILQTPRSLDMLTNTLQVGTISVLLVTAFSVPISWLVHRTSMPFKGFITTAIAVAVLIPGYLKAIGWIMLLSPEVGLVNAGLKSLFGLTQAPLPINSTAGIAFVQSLMLMPTMFFLISGPMTALDPALEESAETCGASKVSTVLRISFPLVWPAVLAGIIYTFMTAISIYEVAALLGGGRIPVLATELFRSMLPDAGLPRYGLAGVYGLLMIVPSVVALYFYFRTIRQAHRYRVISGKGYRPRMYDLGGWTYLGLAYCLSYILLALVLPFIVLVWASLLPSFRMPSAEALALLSFRWYANLWQLVGGMEVIGNTVVLVVGATLISLVASFMMSWVVVRTTMRGRMALDTIAMLPHAIPGLAIAFALMILGILANRFLGIPFYGTIAILIVANAINRLSYTTRVTNAALLQVHAELEEAAQISGARKLPTIWRIVVPLVRPSLVFGGLWTALLIFREVSMALLMTSPSNIVLSVRIWQQWSAGRYAEASALGVVLILVMGLLMLLLYRVAGGRLSAGAGG
jgi:iron(III) transport system permease protein